MFDASVTAEDLGADVAVADRGPVARKARALPLKRPFDVAVCIVVLLPLLLLSAAALAALNPLLNRGPLFFVQTRMGRNCRPFRLLKFRTMREAGAGRRPADGRLEVDRITRFGMVLRKTRIDELPQIVNVLRGEMSLIGPRPDIYEHGLHFCRKIPGYADRHAVRPGISGLAQTEIGYVEGTEATRRKVHADLYYVANMGLLLELWIVWRTVAVILRRDGA